MFLFQECLLNGTTSSYYLWCSFAYCILVAAAESWFSSDTSSGYLEDAIAGWGIWCKQHNLPSYSQDQKVTTPAWLSCSLVSIFTQLLFPSLFGQILWNLISYLINDRWTIIWLIRKIYFQHFLPQQPKSFMVWPGIIFSLAWFGEITSLLIFVAVNLVQNFFSIPFPFPPGLFGYRFCGHKRSIEYAIIDQPSFSISAYEICY